MACADVASAKAKATAMNLIIVTSIRAHVPCSPGVAPARSAPLSLLAKSLENLAPRAGLEPATQRLTGGAKANSPHFSPLHPIS